MKKFLIIALIIAAALLYYFWPSGGQDGWAPNAAVEVIPAYKKSLSDEVEALGTAYANESVNITSNISEYVDEIAFEDGQSVKKDDVILRLKQSEEQAQLKAAEVQRAEHARELKRLRDLLQHKAAAQRDVDERLTQYGLANQQVAEAQARIDDRTIIAKFDGVVGVRRLSPGALVQPGDIITTLDDINVIKLDFTVPESKLLILKEGMALTAMSSVLGHQMFKGSIRTIDTRIDTSSRAAWVRALIPNPDHVLKPGMLLNVSIMGNPREALVLPEETIIARQRDHFVLVVGDEDTIEERPVEVGLRADGLAEIREGLKEGERVIVRGTMKARPGQKAQIAKTWDIPQDGN